MFHIIWHWPVEHFSEIVIGIIFAIVFAVVADAMRVGSRVRGWIRRWVNKRAEASIARLGRRIDQLEKRKTLLASDRGILLLTLRYLLLTMGCFAASAVCVLFNLSLMWLNRFVPSVAEHGKPSDLVDYIGYALVSVDGQLLFFSVAMMMLSLAALSAAQGIKISGLGTPESVQRELSQLDVEIAELQKLRAEKLQNAFQEPQEI